MQVVFCWRNMPDDLRSRIELAARLAGTPSCGEPLLREVLAAGGLGFVTRETLADAGVPRSLRSAVLEALTDSDDSRTARARLQKQVEGLPRALRAAVEHVLRQSEAAVRAERAVFVLGAILRHAAAPTRAPTRAIGGDATAPVIGSGKAAASSSSRASRPDAHEVRPTWTTARAGVCGAGPPRPPQGRARDRLPRCVRRGRARGR